MKVIGQAIAREVGQYPVSPTGACDLIQPGRQFDVYDKHGVPTWADEVVEAPAPTPAPSKPTKGPKPPAAADIA